MLVHATRQLLRSRMLTLVAHVASDAAAPDLVPVYNELLRQASNKVAKESQWLDAKTSARIDLGVDQEFSNLPAFTTAANVLELGVWDAQQERYIPLHRGPIPVALHTDPTNEEGGGSDEATRGRPERYEVGTQIRTWPAADQAYQLKLIHTVTKEMNADEVESALDADLILFLALSLAFEENGDQARSDKYLKLYQDRLIDIRAWINAGNALVVGGRDVFAEGGDGARYDFDVAGR